MAASRSRRRGNTGTKARPQGTKHKHEQGAREAQHFLRTRYRTPSGHHAKTESGHAVFIGGEVDGLDGVVDEAVRRRSARLWGHGRGSRSGGRSLAREQRRRCPGELEGVEGSCSAPGNRGDATSERGRGGRRRGGAQRGRASGTRMRRGTGGGLRASGGGEDRGAR